MQYFYTDVNEGTERKCRCNECGSTELENPRTVEVDHRDKQMFTCMRCGGRPYYSPECKLFYKKDFVGNTVIV